MAITIESQITDVTVYDIHALVTRTASLEITGEEKEIIFPNLPSSIEINSIRISTLVNQPIKVMAVHTEKKYSTHHSSESLSRIDRQIRNTENQIKLQLNKIIYLESLRESLNYLNEKSVENYAHKFSRYNYNYLDGIDGLINFIESKYEDYNLQIVATENHIKKLEQKLLILQQQRQQFFNTNLPQSLNVIAQIATKTAMNYQIKLSYLVKGASWNPLYDLTAETNSNRLKLTYLAEVQQSTGEDWENVNLTLSTAKPALGFIPPKPEPWYVNLFNNYNPPNYSFAQMEMGSGMDTAITAPSAAPKRDVETQATIAATVEKTGSVINFKIDGQSHIPSNGNPHKVTIFEDYYPYQLQYIAIPHLVSYAYLQAKVTNPKTGVTLLPGKTNIFRDTAFLGINQLENIAPGQEFEVNLGIDESIKIERNLVERQTEKTLISNRKKITYAYRLSIINLMDQEKKLKLIEQLPISRHEQLKVNLNQFNPKTEQKEMGILEWNLVLPPNGTRDIYYQFSVEYPPEYNLLGLDR